MTISAARPVYDVAVVGAGPIGSYAALRLAQSGLRVTVLERRPRPDGAVCCTGIVSTACYHRFIESTGVRALPASSAFVIGPSGRILRVEKRQTQAYIVDRPALNARLAEMAVAAGAAYFFGGTVREVSQTTGLCEVQNVHARAVILACGFASTLPHSLGFAPIPDTAVAAQVSVTTSAKEVEVYLDHEIAPGGLAWLVPTWEGCGLAGLVSRSHSAKRLTAFVDALRADGKVTDAAGEVNAKLVPMAVRPGRTAAGNIMVLGEAAGQVKPTTVGGLHSGFLCADIAVETLNAAFRGSRPEKSGGGGRFPSAGAAHPVTLTSYDRRWRSQLGAELRLGHALRRYYDSLSNKQLGRLFEAIAGRHLNEKALEWEDFSFDWHGGPLRRLLIQSGVLRNILTPKLLPLIAAVMKRSSQPIDTH